MRLFIDANNVHDFVLKLSSIKYSYIIRFKLENQLENCIFAKFVRFFFFPPLPPGKNKFVNYNQVRYHPSVSVIKLSKFSNSIIEIKLNLNLRLHNHMSRSTIHRNGIMLPMSNGNNALVNWKVIE